MIVFTNRDGAYIVVSHLLCEFGHRSVRADPIDAFMAEIHCCREDGDLAKAVRHMEELKVRRLPVINKSKGMVGNSPCETRTPSVRLNFS